MAWHCSVHCLSSSLHCLLSSVRASLVLLLPGMREGAWAGAEIEVGQLTQLNHDRNPENLKEGQTILLPAGKLSHRDKDILAGIGSGNYRTYPVRQNETIDDIISKRNISRAEVDALNKGVNLSKLGGARELCTCIQHPTRACPRGDGRAEPWRQTQLSGVTVHWVAQFVFSRPDACVTPAHGREFRA